MRTATVVATILTFALASGARTGLASPSYPGVIASVVDVATPPPCTTCHDTPSGGFGTATKPFAVYLRSRGLVANDEGSLRSALAAANGERHDSDADGVPDIEELKAGTDPSSAASDAPPPPEYGCGNVSGARPPEFGFAALLAIGVLLVRRRQVTPGQAVTGRK